MREHKPHTLYERTETGKYKPVAEYMTFDYWRQGSYMVDIRPGCTSITNMVYINDRVANQFEIMIKRLQDKILDLMAEKAAEPIGEKEPLTPAQLKVWKAWKKAFKKDVVYLRGRASIVEEAMKLVRKELKEQK